MSSMECLGGYTFVVMTSVILSGGVKMRVEHGMLREVCIFCQDFCHTFRSSMECLGRYTFFVMTPSAAFREALSLASRSLQSTAPGAKKARKCQNQEPANTSESRHVKNMRKQRLCQQRRSKQPLATKRPANKSWSAVSRLRRIPPTTACGATSVFETVSLALAWPKSARKGFYDLR